VRSERSNIAICAELYAPIISIRDPEVYQVAVSIPLPQPSTLIGAIGYSYWKMKLCNGEEQCIQRARETVVKARASTTISSKFSVVLSRYRGVLEEKRLPENIDEILGFRDAMVREYVFLDRLKILIIPSHSKYIDEIKKALLITERVGDSESLVSILSVKEEEIKDCNGDSVNVIIRSSLAEGGAYTIVRGLLENGTKDLLALPLLHEKNYYKPSYIRVRRDIKCACGLRFPEGDDW
jgi:CRISPR-associated protein Cas5 subtype I-A